MPQDRILECIRETYLSNPSFARQSPCIRGRTVSTRPGAISDQSSLLDRDKPAALEHTPEPTHKKPRFSGALRIDFAACAA